MYIYITCIPLMDFFSGQSYLNLRKQYKAEIRQRQAKSTEQRLVFLTKSSRSRLPFPQSDILLPLRSKHADRWLLGGIYE